MENGKRRHSRHFLPSYSMQIDPEEIRSPNDIDSPRSQITNSFDMEMPARQVQSFSFPCELAHGSRQVRISGFAHVSDLYRRIADAFKIEERNIMYCTLGTSNVDMQKLIGNQLAFDHTIYVHVRGQTKEVQFTKRLEKLGLTVIDNRNGSVFIKHITPGGIIDDVARQQKDSIAEGDLIECIDGKSFLCCRHADVMRYLKAIPVGSNIRLRLISPEKATFSGIAPRQKISNRMGVGQTIKITTSSAKRASVFQPEEQEIIDQLAKVVEEFIGIADADLAKEIFDLASKSTNRNQFEQHVTDRLGEFKFPRWIVLKFWTTFDNYQLCP